ncbi:trans-sialidase [Trypanosoma cruzi Dm28c]|uniref:Trans-sialidase n=2 Tax=Trypanosoma cruzi TaxID=5693 RepID=V5AUX7_TRYCR|nr:trans-sialidase [Trypanosoma cruzi Dm28c]PBJ79050.1 trans-sialidase [Trypanosoma cruzi cruzi]PWU97778.1 putative trans-sialidase, Group V [Trypanosoma cruzi]
MLSRVAAVKAPRTHNRRRVTGSSGRRREGRESEPQRPHMPRRVFTSAVLLLLIVMMCCDTGGAAATEKPKSGKGSSPSPSFVWKDGKGGETVSSLRVPSLVEMNGDVFAVAEAQLKEEGSFTGIASELLTLTDKESKGELDTNKLKTQVLEECPSQNKSCASQTESQDAPESRKKVLVSRPTTVVNGSDIYMFAGTYRFEVTEGVDRTAAADKWGLLVASGNFRTEGSDKRIYWNDAYVIPWTEFETQQKSLTGLIGGGGSGVKMNDGTLVLPVEGTKTNGKAVSLTLYSTVTGGGNLSKGMSADGCSDPSVVEWKDKLMMMTACDDGRRRVYESAEKGDSWTESLGTLSRVWGNKQGEGAKGVRSGFITATIDGDDKRNVMLVTLPVYPEKDGKKEKGELHLWLTDNTHIVDIGSVSGEGDDAAASSLLYKSGKNGNNNEEKLIALYEKKKVGDEKPSPGMVSVRLTEQLKRVKEVLATWKEVDDRVSKLCPLSSAAVSKSTGTACTTDKITDGLVGFLSGSLSGNKWKDEYLGVNATVNDKEGATEASGGVKFQGAWAEWPVGEQGENQLYHFANHNFTLVATVSIHGVPRSGSVPLMGVRAGTNGGTKLMELSYGSGKKWQALCSDGTTTKLKSTWEPQTQYQVAIVLQNGKQGSAYVDGQRVCGSAQRGLEATEPQVISNFYIGGDGGSAGGQGDVSVTVRNVLLYNRPLTFSGPDAEVERDVASPAGAVSPAKTGDEIKTEGKPATTQQVPTASSSHAVGEAAGNAGTMRGSGPPPSLLLLLGLWGFAAL